jgi:hypothetical protein
MAMSKVESPSLRIAKIRKMSERLTEHSGFADHFLFLEREIYLRFVRCHHKWA